jgi:hypothetical protein
LRILGIGRVRLEKILSCVERIGEGLIIEIAGKMFFWLPISNGGKSREKKKLTPAAMQIRDMMVNGCSVKTNVAGQHSRQQREMLKPHDALAMDGTNEILDVSALYSTPIKPWRTENGWRNKLLQILPLIDAFRT